MTTRSYDEQNKMIETHFQTLFYHPTKFGCSSLNRFCDLEETSFFVVGQETDNRKWISKEMTKKAWGYNHNLLFLKISGNSIQSSWRYSAWLKRRANFMPGWAPRNSAVDIKFNRAQFQAIVYISWKFHSHIFNSFRDHLCTK